MGRESVCKWGAWARVWAGRVCVSGGAQYCMGYACYSQLLCVVCCFRQVGERPWSYMSLGKLVSLW